MDKCPTPICKNCENILVIGPPDPYQTFSSTCIKLVSASKMLIFGQFLARLHEVHRAIVVTSVVRVYVYVYVCVRVLVRVTLSVKVF